MTNRWDTSQGMAENPGESYSLASRLVCAKCLTTPKIKNPASLTNAADPLVITVECHGKTETKAIEKAKLIFTQRFFEDEAIEEDLE